MNSFNKFKNKYVAFEKKIDFYQTLLLNLFVPVGLFGITFRFLFEWTFKQSPWLLLLAIILAAAFVYFIYQAIRYDTSQYPTVSLTERRKLDAKVIGMFLTKVFVAILAFSATSFLFFHFHLANYVTNDNPSLILSMSILNDFYFWYTFDIVPGFDICGTLDWQRNVDASNLLSRILVLLYQVFFTYIVFVSYKKWRANRKIPIKNENNLYCL